MFKDIALVYVSVSDEVARQVFGPGLPEERREQNPEVAFAVLVG